MNSFLKGLMGYGGMMTMIFGVAVMILLPIFGAIKFVVWLLN